MEVQPMFHHTFDKTPLGSLNTISRTVPISTTCMHGIRKKNQPDSSTSLQITCPLYILYIKKMFYGSHIEKSDHTKRLPMEVTGLLTVLLLSTVVHGLGS